MASILVDTDARAGTGERSPSLPGRVVDWAASERLRWPLFLPVGMAIGVAFYFSLPTEPPWWTGPAAALLAAALTIGLRRRSLLQPVALAALALCLGFAAAQLRTLSVSAPLLPGEIGPVTVEGRVEEIERRVQGARIVVGAPRIGDLGASATPAQVRIVLARDLPDLRPGDRIRVTARLRPPPPPVAPGAFDFQRHTFFAGIGAVGFAYGAPERIEPAAGTAPLARFRDRLSRDIRDALPGTTGAVAAALLTGLRGAIPEPALEAMRASGLAHLLAISGLHLGLIAGTMFFALRFVMASWETLALTWPIKKIAAAAALATAAAYLLLAGAPVPTQRAFLMTGLVLAAVMLDRTAISMRLVAWAATVVLLLRPETVLGPSFQMSFAAVIGLVAAYEGWRTRRDVEPDGIDRTSLLRRGGIYVGGILLSSVVATVATAPIALHHFQTVPAYGVLANMIAVPLTAVMIMPAGLIALLLDPVGLATPPLVVMGWGIDMVLAVAKTVSAWPGAVIRLPAPPAVATLLMVGGGLWLCLFEHRPRWLGLMPVAAGLALALTTTPPDLFLSSDGRLIGIRDGDSLRVSSLRRRRFDRDMWARLSGLDAAAGFPEAGPDRRALSCDPGGCILRRNGHIVALSTDRLALAEDCRHAGVVVSTVWAGPCAARLVIDPQDTRRRGAVALWLEPTAARVAGAEDGRGRRPWVVPRPPDG